MRRHMTFFKDNSYNIVKMMLYQFGTTLLGAITSMAAQSNTTLFLIASIYATLFYFYLLYSMTWEIGAKDRIRVDAGHARADRLTGLKIALFANIPNFIVTLLIAVGFLFGVVLGTAEWAQGMLIVGHGIGMVIQAMYNGLINFFIPASGSALSGAYLIAYTITPFIGILWSVGGYLMGWHDRRLFGWLFPRKKK